MLQVELAVGQLGKLHKDRIGAQTVELVEPHLPVVRLEDAAAEALER